MTTETEQRFAELLKKIHEHTDQKAAYNLSREATNIALNRLKTPDSYQKLVDISEKFPRCAGMIYDRMSESLGLEEYTNSVSAKAKAYLAVLDLSGKNDIPLARTDLDSVKSVAIIDPRLASKVLSGFKYLEPDLDEHDVVNAMMEIVGVNPRTTTPSDKVYALKQVLRRGTNVAITRVAQHLVQEILPLSSLLVAETLAALAQTPSTTPSQESSICRLMRAVAVKQDELLSGLACLNTRHSEESYEIMVDMVKGWKTDKDDFRYYPTSLKHLALPAINMIISDPNRKEGLVPLRAIQRIAAVHADVCDPVARDFFVKEGTPEALSRIPFLQNTDTAAQAFLEKDGGTTAIAAWNKKAERGSCAIGQQLKGLLTLRFNVAQSGQENLQEYDREIKDVANQICRATAENILRLKTVNMDKAMRCLVFGKDKTQSENGTFPDWVEALKTAFDDVRKANGYHHPSIFLEAAVGAIKAKEIAQQSLAGMDVVLHHLEKR